MSFLGFAGDLQSSFQSVQNLKSVFDMDALKDKIEAEEKEQDKVTENSKKKVDEVSYEKRGNNSSNNPGDVPIVSSASLLSPAEAKKLKSFSTGSGRSSATSQVDNNKAREKVGKARYSNGQVSSDSLDGKSSVDGSDDDDDDIESGSGMRLARRDEGLEEYVPGRVGGRYDDTFSRDSANETTDTSSSDGATSGMFGGAGALTSAVTFFRNVDWRYLRNGIGEILEEHKSAVWTFLSFLLLYKFLF